MKPEELIEKIIKEGELKDNSVGTIVDWIIGNQGKNNVSEYLEAIDKDEIVTLTPEGKAQHKIFLKKLKYWNLYNGLGIRFSEKGWSKESQLIFDAILRRTPSDIDSLHNYGTALINTTLALYKQGINLDKKQLEKARQLIFSAYTFDKKVHEDKLIKPAYMNLCYLRAIEAVYHFNKRESFTAFVLAWMSIEMTIYKLWYQFLRKKTTQKIEDLMRWDTEHIIETLFLSDTDELIKIEKVNLDTLKGIRNRLLHGDINDPTLGDAKLCIDTALALQRPKL